MNLECWSTGVTECWHFLHYSIAPLLHYSFEVRLYILLKAQNVLICTILLEAFIYQNLYTFRFLRSSLLRTYHKSCRRRQKRSLHNPIHPNIQIVLRPFRILLGVTAHYPSGWFGFFRHRRKKTGARLCPKRCGCDRVRSTRLVYKQPPGLKTPNQAISGETLNPCSMLPVTSFQKHRQDLFNVKFKLFNFGPMQINCLRSEPVRGPCEKDKRSAQPSARE